MSQDLAALAPSAIVCVAFLVGAWLLVRRELAPRRQARGTDAVVAGDDAAEYSPTPRPMAKGAVVSGGPGEASADAGRPAAGEAKSLYFTAS